MHLAPTQFVPDELDRPIGCGVPGVAQVDVVDQHLDEAAARKRLGGEAVAVAGDADDVPSGLGGQHRRQRGRRTPHIGDLVGPRSCAATIDVTVALLGTARILRSGGTAFGAAQDVSDAIGVAGDVRQHMTPGPARQCRRPGHVATVGTFGHRLEVPRQLGLGGDDHRQDLVHGIDATWVVRGAGHSGRLQPCNSE